jgi:APA family basic amino acid/polyamine antiporter
MTGARIWAGRLSPLFGWLSRKVHGMAGSVFARKPLDMLLDEVRGKDRLKRVLGPLALTSMGIGAVIGAGIFVSTGQAARQTAGPSLMLSYAVSGTVCVFAALCYAEFASMVPVAGSAYTYAYATLGELFAWIIGWDLLLEYAVGSAVVANSWSSYFQEVLATLGLPALPGTLNGPVVRYNANLGQLEPTGTYINLPAVLIVVAIALLLVKGIQESARFNAAMVAVKLSCVLFVLVVGAYFVNPANWKPFAPHGYGGLNFLGYTLGKSDAGGQPLGMLAGAAIAFFSYIGFDAVSTQAEEAKNPGRDVPIGIMASLLICTALYIAVIAVLTGMVPYHQIDLGAPVSKAFEQVGLGWARFLIAAGGLTGITSVLVVLLLSQPRILLAMARDGLISQRYFGAVHSRFQTPHRSTILTGAFVAVMAAFLPMPVLLNLANIGTLFAFVIVCAGVMVMRKTNPGAARPFRVPFVPYTPVVGILACLLLMFSLPAVNWLRLIAWLVIGLAIYFAYGRYNSVLARRPDTRG